MVAAAIATTQAKSAASLFSSFATTFEQTEHRSPLRTASSRTLTEIFKPTNMNDLTNKKIVIVGASSGIGKALSHICAAKGITVIMTSRSIDKLEKARQDIKGNTKAIALDMLNEVSVRNAFEEIDHFDYLVVTAIADETKLSSQIKDMTTEIAQQGMENFGEHSFAVVRLQKKYPKMSVQSF
jgi:NADPH:quinone reductase-like Zn-dependent oxidoreductase